MKCYAVYVLELALEDVHKKVDLIAMTRATAKKKPRPNGPFFLSSEWPQLAVVLITQAWSYNTNVRP